MKDFLTLQAAWEDFLANSNIRDVAGDDPHNLEAAKALFMAGCQGALGALSNIKDAADSDPKKAVPFITALYDESLAFVMEHNRQVQEERLREPWSFPTGEKK